MIHSNLIKVLNDFFLITSTTAKFKMFKFVIFNFLNFESIAISINILKCCSA